MRYAKLRGKIREVYGTTAKFAEDLGVDSSTLSFKLNGRRTWREDEMAKACELLHIPIETIHEYFFKK